MLYSIGLLLHIHVLYMFSLCCCLHVMHRGFPAGCRSVQESITRWMHLKSKSYRATSPVSYLIPWNWYLQSYFIRVNLSNILFQFLNPDRMLCLTVINAVWTFSGKVHYHQLWLVTRFLSEAQDRRSRTTVVRHFHINNNVKMFTKKRENGAVYPMPVLANM